MMSPTTTSAGGRDRGAARRGRSARRARAAGLDAATIAAASAHPPAVSRSPRGGADRRLPGNAYAVGFLRTYAQPLGLDPDEIARRFKAEAAEVEPQDRTDFPAPVPERGVPAGAMVLLGVVLAIGAYAGWYRLSGDGRLPAETVAAGARAPRAAGRARRSPPRRRGARPPAAARRGAAGRAVQPAASRRPRRPAPAIAAHSCRRPAAARRVDRRRRRRPAPLPPQPVDPRPASRASSLQATADAWLQVRDRKAACC